MEEKVASAEGDSDLRKELLEIYTPLSVAKEEIWKRWNDKELKKKVEKFLNGTAPNYLKKSPHSFLVRQITSPDVEFFHFLDLSEMLKLDPLFVEYREDKFTSCNDDKYYRCNMYFYEGEGRSHKNIIKSKKIIDFDKYDGKKIKDVETLWQSSILDFHHNLIREIYPSAFNSIVDVSDWVKKNGKTASNYYLHFLAWFICHGVLFENFPINKKGIDFTRKLVLENMKKLEKEFGVKPLILPIAPIEDQGDVYWWSYPEKVGSIVYSMKMDRQNNLKIKN